MMPLLHLHLMHNMMGETHIFTDAQKGALPLQG